MGCIASKQAHAEAHAAGEGTLSSALRVSQFTDLGTVPLPAGQAVLPTVLTKPAGKRARFSDQAPTAVSLPDSAADAIRLAACNAGCQDIVLGSGPNSPAGGRLSSHSRRASNVSLRDSGLSVEPSGRSKVAADFASIIDDQGMLNTLVSRQMSSMSRYSVRSESGSVLITPETAPGAPFQLKKLIGKGGFGNVYLAKMNEGEFSENEYVAVKIIQGYNDADQPDEKNWEIRKERMAQMEAVLMSAIEHENIVQTLKVTAHQGASQVDPELSALERQLLRSYGGASHKEEMGLPNFEWHITMEYCDRGSLSSALSSFMLHTPIDTQTVKWDAWASLEILKEVTASLIFLHEHRILHGDLKAANVLLKTNDSDRRKYLAKVSDFGLSRVLNANKNHIKTQTFGTVTHVPPELLAKGMLTAKADVYAIGVLMWEIFTGEKVFKQLSDSEVILAVVTRQARPLFPTDVPSRYKFLAERCWSEMMELRPGLQVVMSELQKLQDSICPDGPDSAMIATRIYPTRAKALAENIKKRASMAQQAQAAAEKAAAIQASIGAPAAAAAKHAALFRADSGSPPQSLDSRSPTKTSPTKTAVSSGGALPSATGRAGDTNGASLNRPQSFSASVGNRMNVRGSSGGGGGGSSQRNNSVGLPMSPLAPQNAGSPSRAHGCSIQRPAEPRQSAGRLPQATSGENAVSGVSKTGVLVPSLTRSEDSASSPLYNAMTTP
ncbi:hypothetical protein FOA52_007120 [Chlamydomonas sp. UWO 241]|nr:hypothetical protein FOA52_007120 [Chlamydomonas sp. UWO 241]